jgi:hypothetical protein
MTRPLPMTRGCRGSGWPGRPDPRRVRGPTSHRRDCPAQPLNPFAKPRASVRLRGRADRDLPGPKARVDHPRDLGLAHRGGPASRRAGRADALGRSFGPDHPGPPETGRRSFLLATLPYALCKSRATAPRPAPESWVLAAGTRRARGRDAWAWLRFAGSGAPAARLRFGPGFVLRILVCPPPGFASGLASFRGYWRALRPASSGKWLRSADIGAPCRLASFRTWLRGGRASV